MDIKRKVIIAIIGMEVVSIAAVIVFLFSIRSELALKRPYSEAVPETFEIHTTETGKKEMVAQTHSSEPETALRGFIAQDIEHETINTKYSLDHGGVCLGGVEDKEDFQEIYAAFIRGEHECQYEEWGGPYTLAQLCKKGCETYTAQSGWYVDFDESLSVKYGYWNKGIIVNLFGCESGGYIFWIEYDGSIFNVIDSRWQPARGSISISKKGVERTSWSCNGVETCSYAAYDSPSAESVHLGSYNIIEDSEESYAEFVCDADSSLSYTTDNQSQDSAEFNRRVAEFEKNYVGDWVSMTTVDTTSWF